MDAEGAPGPACGAPNMTDDDGCTEGDGRLGCAGDARARTISSNASACQQHTIQSSTATTMGTCHHIQLRKMISWNADGITVAVSLREAAAAWGQQRWHSPPT